MSERYEPVWFRTAQVPPHRRAGRLAQVLSDLIGPVGVDLPARPRKPPRLVRCDLPGALIATAMELRARIRFAGWPGSSEVLLLRPVGGAVRLSQGNREAVLVEREAALLSLGLPFDLDATGAERFDFLRICAPTAAMQPASAAVVLRPALATDNRLVLLTHYAGALLQGMIPLETERHARLAGNHLRDLAGTLFGLDEPLDAGTAPALRLSAIKEQMERAFARHDLTVDAVAAAQGVTPRYVQKLFAAEGTTFTRHLVERRLQAAHAILSAPHPPAIAAVALDCGFNDLSYFNRCFRRRFGLTPSQARRAARERGCE